MACPMVLWASVTAAVRCHIRSVHIVVYRRGIARPRDVASRRRARPAPRAPPPRRRPAPRAPPARPCTVSITGYLFNGNAAIAVHGDISWAPLSDYHCIPSCLIRLPSIGHLPQKLFSNASCECKHA
ncbi:hypothetical protein O0L34_g18411 [Tuta absoluta]|nr:hypothetical protein O0L34_g18411 [Tuta absoluta]